MSEPCDWLAILDSAVVSVLRVCIPVMLTPNSNDCDPAALKVLTRW